jgi:hypothetical protein
MSEFVYINFITSPIKNESIDFPELPNGCHLLGISIIDDNLNYRMRCVKENVEATETIVQETLEIYKNKGIIDFYKIIM